MSKVLNILPMTKGRSTILLLAVLIVAAATLLSGAFTTKTSAAPGDYNPAYGGFLNQIAKGTGAITAVDIVNDASGNTYIAGNFAGTADFDPGAGTTNLVSAGAADVFVAKYDSGGNLIFAVRYGSAAADAAGGLACNATDCFVGIAFVGTIDPGAAAGADMVSAGGADTAIVKLNAITGAYVAQAHAVKGDDGNSASAPTAIVIDGSVLYVQANYDGANDCDPSGSDLDCTATNASNIDVLILKGTTGLAFTAFIASAKSATDNAGAGMVLIGSSLYSVVTFTGTVNPGGGNLASAGAADIVLVKNAKANLAYEAQLQLGGAGADAVTGIAVVNGKPTIIGHFTGNVDFGGGSLTNAGGTDVIIAQRAAADLAHGWTKHLGGTGADTATSIAADGTTHLVVGGSFTGAVTFVTSAITSAGGLDGFVVQLTDAGAPVWANKVGGTGADTISAVAVASNQAYAVADFAGTLIDIDQGAAAAVLTSAGNSDVALMRFTTVKEVPAAVCSVSVTDANQGATTNCSATGTSLSLVITGGAAGNYTHISNTGTAAQGKVSATLGSGLTTLHKAPLVSTVSATTGIASVGRTDTISNAGLRRPSSIQIGVDKNNDGDFTDAGDTVHYVNIAWWGAPATTLNEVADNYDYDNADANQDFSNGATNAAYAANRSKVALSAIGALGTATITSVIIEDAANVGRLAGSLTLTLGSGVFTLTGTNSYSTVVTASATNDDLIAASLAVTGLPTGATPAKVSLTAVFTGATGTQTLTTNFVRIGAASSLVMKVISCGTACSTALDNTAVTVIPTLTGGVTGNSTLPTANAIYALSLKATDSAGNVVTGLVVNISDDDNGDGNDNDGATELYYGIDGSLGGITITGTSATGNTNLTTGATYQSLFVITVAKAASATNAGTMTIKAKAGTLTASLDITVRGAAATYAVSGPASVAPGAIGIYTVTASDVNGNTPSVQAASAITTPTFVVTNLGTSGKTVSTSATTVSVSPITGGTITIIAPSGGGSGTLAVISGGKIVASTNISYGTPAASTTSIALSAGWNLIRWSGSAKSVATAVNASVTSVYGWNATTQTWNMWSPAGVGIPGANDLSELASGGIYWVYSVTTGTLQ